MLFIYFIICAAVVIFFSIKLSNCADWFEKNTTMSGALVGFLLAATTSIPELVSGITSVLINQEEIAISSILGSNLFNYNIVVVSNLTFITFFAFNKLSKTNIKIILFILSIYAALIISLFTNSILDFTILSRTISLVSIIILVIYITSVIVLKETDEEKSEKASKKSIIKTFTLFIIYAIVLVASSSILAILVESIMNATGISASVAGSILLGASTSLPEFVGAISLMRMKQYDIAVSSVLSSNLFNFFVLFILDIISINAITSFFSTDTIELIMIGTFNTIILFTTFLFFKSNRKYIYAIPSILILIIYLIYLIFFT